MMEDLQQRQIEKIRYEFFLSNSLLAILFIVSFTGLVVGVMGWLHIPIFVWMIPESYYITIAFAALSLMGLTIMGGTLIWKLRISFAEFDHNF